MKNRKRNRMQGFDYSSDNLYFVTICVKDRVCCFGSVVSVGTGRDLSVRNPNEINPNEINPNESSKKMELNEFGKIVYDRMLWLAEQYQYVELHNFVVMPNHVHAIIGISVGTGRDLSVRDLSVRDLSVRDLSVRDVSMQEEEIKTKSLSSLMGAFKTTSSKIIHLAGFVDFAWQRSFHDHIIRNEKSYLNISNYIESNPDRWAVDTFFEKS
jgi:putative transposase